MCEAAGVLRSLIEKIVIYPDESCQLPVELHGQLASAIALAKGEPLPELSQPMVAGQVMQATLTRFRFEVWRYERIERGMTGESLSA